MPKPTFKKMIPARYVITSALVGVILLSLTLFFRVNPAEGSVVDENIIGTPFHYFLYFTTMPAWIAGIFIGRSTFLSFPLMFLIQIIIFSFLGFLFYLALRPRHNDTSTTRHLSDPPE